MPTPIITYAITTPDCQDSCTNHSNGQDVSPSESSNPTAADPERRSVTEEEDTELKITAIDMFEDVKEDMDKSLNKVYASTNCGMK